MKKVTFDREFLQLTLSKSVKFVPSKSIIPAFENIMVSVSNGIASFTSCDANAQLGVKCTCKGDDMAFCVNAKLFLKTVSLFSDNNVVVSMKEENKLQIKSGKSKSNITLDCAPKDYPMMTYESLPNEININDFYLKKALKSASKFVDDSGNNISCINIINVGNEIVFTARSQAQLVRIGVKPISISAWAPLNIFPELSDKISTLLSDNGEVCIAHCTDKVVFMRSTEDPHSDFTVIATAANTKYPDVETLINKNMSETKILLNTVEAVSAVKRLSLYVDIAKVMSIATENDTVIMKAVNSMKGFDCEEEMAFSNKQGVHNLNKNFNVDFLIQIFNEIESNDFWFAYDEDTKKPTFIIPNEGVDKNINYIFITKELFL